MKDIVLQNVKKAYNGRVILDGFDMTLAGGKISCIVGASGIGKTTVLNIVGGLTDCEGSVTGVPQDISYIFQETNLAPNLSVAGNLEFVLRAKIPDKKLRAQTIAEALDAVGLSGYANRYPYELSIGMAQRISMARAFAYPSDLILMDEPFRGLDIATKAKLITYFLALWAKTSKTVLLVTHNIDEAVLLSDKIFVLSDSPAKISAEFSISSQKSERKLSDPEIADAFGRIYDLFFNRG